MQRQLLASAPFILALLTMVAVVAAAPHPQAVPNAQLAPVSSFDRITDKAERSRALFMEVAKVIASPRCMNCHPAADRPSQGDDSHPHQPLVVRGPDGMGAPAMRCTACHQEANYAPSGVPGALGWHLAPMEMAWQGKSLAAICAQIKDKERNGGRDLAGLVHHVEDPHLVGWGWHPGGKRTPAPGTQAQFVQLLKAWADTGAACPTE